MVLWVGILLLRIVGWCEKTQETVAPRLSPRCPASSCHFYCFSGSYFPQSCLYQIPSLSAPPLASKPFPMNSTPLYLESLRKNHIHENHLQSHSTCHFYLMQELGREEDTQFSFCLFVSLATNPSIAQTVTGNPDFPYKPPWLLGSHWTFVRI